jgi:tetratricopeptide (TPR) repeat protein
VGVVHEYPCLIDSTISTESGVINNCYIKDGQCGARSNTGSCKFDRDIKLLLKGLEDEPNNSRYYFYLAQSYHDKGDYENAMKYYKKRISMEGWNEEVYYSMYRYAQCKMKLKDKLNITFEEVALDYVKAYNYRPCRLEALYDIVRYCRENEKIQMAYAFAIMANDTFTNYPQDILFVDSDIHRYKFMDELAISAYYSNNHTLAISINNKLIEMINNNEINLDLSRIIKNKEFSVNAIKKDITKYLFN